MLEQPAYAWPGSHRDLAELIAAHPWVTLVSATTEGLVVSHLPVVVHSTDEGAAASDDEPPVVLGHLPVADAHRHRPGEADAVVVVSGPHGYITAGWYVGGPHVSTWNYVVAHLHGRLEPLGAEATFDVLARTQEHLESSRPEPFRLEAVIDYARRIAPAVVGFRLAPARVEAKAKLSQDKPPADIDGVLRGLEDPDDVHANPQLADAMRRGGLPEEVR